MKSMEKSKIMIKEVEMEEVLEFKYLETTLLKLLGG